MIIIPTLQKNFNAANIYEVSSMCWVLVLYYAISYVILIFKTFCLCCMGIYLYFTREEIEVERPSGLTQNDVTGR